MVSKNFEQTIRFHEIHVLPGNSIWLPLVEVILLTQGCKRIALSLYFDTGASVTTLRADQYPLLGLHSWNQGTPVAKDTGGGRVTDYEYRADVEVFGKIINCPIHLSQTLRTPPLFCGLLGRDTIFENFGFGFWESAHELYVTANP
jgi:hypothetical protein